MSCNLEGDLTMTTKKYYIIVAIVSAIAVTAFFLLNDSAMTECLKVHSSDVCHHTLNR